MVTLSAEEHDSLSSQWYALCVKYHCHFRDKGEKELEKLFWCLRTLPLGRPKGINELLAYYRYKTGT